MDFRERLRAKLQRMKNPQKREKRTWSPPKDVEKSVVRLIANPYSSDPQAEPFVELWFHYGIGGTFGILCPRQNSGDNCPACELVDELKKSKDEKDVKLRKDIQAKQRAYCPLIDRADTAAVPTPKYWGFGFFVHRKLIDYAANPDWELFYDPRTGRDLEVTQSQAAGKKFADTDVVLKPNRTPLLKSEADIEKVLANIPPITEVFKPMSSAQIKAKVNEFLNLGADEAESASAESVRGGGSSAAASDSVDSAFDEALAE